MRAWSHLEGPPTVPSAEKWVLDRAANEELWALVRSRLQDEQERLVAVSSFEYGLPPREIAANYPRHFPDVRAVYRVKERVVDRLSHDPQLGRWYEERVLPLKNNSSHVE